MDARTALSLSVWAWLAQWGTVAFLSFHPALAAAILLASAPAALALLRMEPSRAKSQSGLGRVTVPLLALPAGIVLLSGGAGVGIVFPSFWLSAPDAPVDNARDSVRSLGLALSVVLLVVLGYLHRSASRHASQPVLRPATVLVGCILGLSIAAHLGQLSHPLWGWIHMALHVILAVHLVRASGSLWGTHTPFLVWTCLVTAATLMDGRIAEEPNLAVPLVSAMLPLTIGLAAWHLWKEGVFWPALTPLIMVALATAVVAADYVVRWFVVTGTAFDPGVTASLNILGLAYPCAAWLALRTVVYEWRREAPLPGVVPA